MYAFGYIERKEDGEQMIKKLRLQRIQEVRVQEQGLVRQRCSIYREAIEEKKNEKRRALRAHKLQLLEAAHDKLAKKWRKSLVDTGEAQRGAEAMASAAIEEVKTREEDTQRKKQFEEVRQKEALRVVNQATRASKMVLVRKKEHRKAVEELQKSNREDAHKAHEARVSRRAAEEKALSASHTGAGPLVIKQPPAGQSASSVRAQQGAPVAVHAAVMKHGATSADITVVKNDAKAESVVCFKRMFNMVISEMNNRAKAKARSRMAVKTSALQKNQDDLEHEFGILHTLDRSGSRGARIKNTAAVSPSEESPAVAQAFENTFLARHKAEMEALETVTNDSDSVIDTEASVDYSEDFTAKKGGVGFAAADSADSGASKAKLVEKYEPIPTAASTKSAKEPSPPKVSFRSATNRPVAPVATVPRSARSIIPSATVAPRKHDVMAAGGGAVDRLSYESIDIARTSAVSAGSETQLSFSQQAAAPEWSTPSFPAAQDDDSSVQFEINSEYGTTDDFSIGSDSKLMSGYADLHTESVDSLAMDSGALERQYLGPSSVVDVGVDDVEITRRAMAMETMFSTSMLSVNEGMGDLQVSFSSEEGDMQGLKSTYKGRANTSWLSQSTAQDEIDNDNSSFSDAVSSASTHTARHDAEAAHSDDSASASSRMLSSTASIGSAEYRDGVEEDEDLGVHRMQRNAEGEEDEEETYEDYYNNLSALQEEVVFLDKEEDDEEDEEEDKEEDKEEDAQEQQIDKLGIGSAHESVWQAMPDSDDESHPISSSSSSSSSSMTEIHNDDAHDESEDLHFEDTELDSRNVRLQRHEGEEEEQAQEEEEEEEEEALTVRLEGATGIFSTMDSVSFESLFVEDEEEEDDEEDEEEDVSSSDSDADSIEYYTAKKAPTTFAEAAQAAAEGGGSHTSITRSSDSNASSSMGSPGFSLSEFISKYAASEDAAAVQDANVVNPMSHRSPVAVTAAVRSSSDMKREGDMSTYEKYQQQSKIVSSEALRSSYNASESVSSSYHSQSLRELLGIREGEDLISINKYKRGSFDSEDEVGSESSTETKQKASAFGSCDVDDDLSDEDDAGADLVKEIDEMKARLMNVMHMPALAKEAAAASAAVAALPRSSDSKISEDASLSQHPLESQFISASSSSSSTGDSSLSFHRLDAGFESMSKTSADEMFTKLDVALGRALASSTTSSTMEGLVEQYLQSMSSSSHHLISRSIADYGSDSDYGSLSGGNLSSLKTAEGNPDLTLTTNHDNDSATEDDVISV